MKNLPFICLLFVVVFFISCEKENEYKPSTTYPIHKDKIKGYVQKGPYINGTSITIYELTTGLTQTGKTFSTQISDSKGSFELKEVELSSQFAELKADGFYFNEVLGDVSSAQLTLCALSDLTDKNNLNVNVLSHLEKNRINNLISQGFSFNEAKGKAQKEILKIFSIDKSDMLASELLNISKDGDDNGILLAISVILQGFRTDAELSELLANISTDISTDGVLDNKKLGTKLINHAQLLNLSEIRNNLLDRYSEMGAEANIPNFEKYVQLFKDSTDFEYTNFIVYPKFSNYGENILFADKLNIKPQRQYSLAAELPRGTELKIVLQGGLWYYEYMPHGPKNWKISQYDYSNKYQTFTSKVSGVDCDLKISFRLSEEKRRSDTITVAYYENKSETPTKIKKIIIK